MPTRLFDPDLMPSTYLKQTIPAMALAILAGCNDTGPPSQDAVSSSSSEDDGVVAKIAVMTDGTVYVNSESVTIEALASKLDELGKIREVWYHREAPEAAEPHDNAMTVIAEIADRGLPIAMYIDAEFKERATFGQ